MEKALTVEINIKLTKIKHIDIFLLIQWFTDVCYSKINDLFFSLFFEYFSAVVGTKEYLV